MRQLFKSRHIHALVKRLARISYIYHNNDYEMPADHRTIQFVYNRHLRMIFVEWKSRKRLFLCVYTENEYFVSPRNTKHKNLTVKYIISVRSFVLQFTEKLWITAQNRRPNVEDRVQRTKCQEKAQVLTSAVTIHSLIFVHKATNKHP